MKQRFQFFALILMLCSTGCLDFSYDGASTSGQSDAVFVDKADDKITYKVLGTAQVAGDYTTFSLDDMKMRLKRGADEIGADGIIIRSIQVVPKGSAVHNDPALESVRATTSATSFSERMATEFAVDYGNVRQHDADQNASTAYRRIIIADYVSFPVDDSVGN